MLFVLNTIRVKLFINFPLNSVLCATLYTNFGTHLISSDICFPILNSQMSMSFDKLQSTFMVKLFKEESSSSYSMIIAKSFEAPFKGGGVNIKLKVSDDRWD